MKVRCLYDRLVPISDLKLNPQNRNAHPKEQITRLAEILKYQGWRFPVKISKQTGLVTAGHGRVEAALANSWTEVPVNYQDYDTPEQEYADLVADNAIASWSELDLSGVQMDVKGLATDFNPIYLGLKHDLPEEEKLPPGCDEDEVPEHVEPFSKPGSHYLLGDHHLLCGDSTSIDAVEKLMAGEKADMVFTDPPYNIDYQGVSDKREKIKNDKMSDEDFLDFLIQSIHPSDVMYVCCSWQYAHLFKMAMTQLGHPPKAMIIWDKVNPAQHLDLYFKQHEIIFYHGPFGGNKTVRGDIWQLKRQKNTVHPTMKPIELIEMALEDHPKKKIVYDSFGGSGSTLIACEKTGRKCYTMELDPHYCDTIVARYEKYSGKKAILLEG